MYEYIGTKLIKAIKMNNHAFAVEKYGEEKLNNEFQEGYKVVYEDGYTSWSPKDVFEKAYKKVNGEFKIVEHDLITNDNTIIFKDEISFKAPYNYIIQNPYNENILSAIHFQEGPINESGLNGIFMEDLIAVCINRLEHFQESEFTCKENDEAIKKLEESLMWMRKRTLNRQKRNVINTSEI
jgi:hypothetical protein